MTHSIQPTFSGTQSQRHSYLLPEPTFDDIKKATYKLLVDNDKTTHLDIKLALRAEGFWATQYAVAESVYALIDLKEFPWPWTFNGKYRTYYAWDYMAHDEYNLSTDVVQTSWQGWIDDPVALAPALAATLDLGSETLLVPLSIPASTPQQTFDPQPGDWEAFTYDESTAPIFVTGVNHPIFNSARNIARNFYSENLKAVYAITGAHKIQ